MVGGHSDSGKEGKNRIEAKSLSLLAVPNEDIFGMVPSHQGLLPRLPEVFTPVRVLERLQID